MRAKYYRELKKFVCIPLHFRGVGEASSAALTIFPRMIGRNAHGFSVVYRKVCECICEGRGWVREERERKEKGRGEDAMGEVGRGGGKGKDGRGEVECDSNCNKL